MSNHKSFLWRTTCDFYIFHQDHERTSPCLQSFWGRLWQGNAQILLSHGVLFSDLFVYRPLFVIMAKHLVWKYELQIFPNRMFHGGDGNAKTSISDRLRPWIMDHKRFTNSQRTKPFFNRANMSQQKPDIFQPCECASILSKL